MKELELLNTDRVGLVSIIYASDMRYSGAEKTYMIADILKTLKENYPDTSSLENEDVEKRFDEFLKNKQPQKIVIDNDSFALLSEIVKSFVIPVKSAEAMANIFKVLKNAKNI